MYSTPSLSPGQIGYMYSSTSIGSPTATISAQCTFSAVPPGVYLATWSFGTATMTGQLCTFGVWFGSTTIGATVVINNPSGAAYTTGGGTVVGTNPTTQNISLFGQSSVNSFWLDRGYFQVVRIA